MEDKDTSQSCDIDSDTPIYVGQSPVVCEQEQDDDDVSYKAMDRQVLIEDTGGFTQEHGSLVSSEKQSDDHPSLDCQQSMESCQALNSASPEKLGMTSKYDGDTCTFDLTTDDGCNRVDEYSDDEEIRVGHEGKKADTPPRNEVLVLECKKSLLEDLSKLDCSTVGTAGNRNADYRSSASKVTHYTHLSICETLSCADVDRTCDAKKGCESEDLRVSCINSGNHRTSNHDRSDEKKDEPGSEECPDKIVNPIIIVETPQMSAPDGDNDATLTPNRAQSSSNLEDHPKASSSRIKSPEENGAEETHHGVPKTFDSTCINASPLRHTCRKQGAKAEDVSKAQKFISESELQTISNEPKGEKLECSPATCRKPYSLRNRRRQTSFQEDMIKSKPKTPPKESLIVSCKSPKTTFKEYEEREVTSLPPTRRTSPRKRNKVNHVEDHTHSKDVHLVCDKNVNSKIEQEENDPLHGKERRSTSRRENVNTDILDQKSSGLCSDFEVDDCEPASSQIYTGAPMFSTSKKKTRKRSRKGKGSFCQTGEDVTEVGEVIQMKVDDTPNERIESTIPQPEQSLEGEKRNSNEQQSSTSDLNPACVTGTCPSSEVLKTSNRQRRRKQSCHHQSETSVTVNELINAGKRKEEQTVKRTRKVNKTCETSKKQKCLGNKIDVIDALIEPPQETAHIENKEALDDLEKPEEPTPPEKRCVYRARRCQSRGRKSVYDLINDLTAASASALKRASESTSPPSSKENQESSPTGQAKKRQASKKGKVTKDRPSRKRKYRGCSPGEDDPQLSDPVQPGNDEMKASYASPEQCVTMLRPGSFFISDKSGDDDDDELINPVLTPDSKTKDVSPEQCATMLRPGSFFLSEKNGDDDDDELINQVFSPDSKTKDASPEQCATMLRPGSFFLSDSGDDDDDELINPVLTPDSKTKDLPPAFCINDVVWALDPADKSRWPAVVIEVTGENVSRRVYNVFKTNQAEEKYFQVKSSRYLKPYNCREKKRYLEKGKEMNEFNKAVEKANNFIMKIGLGKVNSYEDFFKPSDAYLDSPPTSPDYTSPPSPPLIVGHNIPEYPPISPKPSPHLVEDDDDDEEEEEEEEEEEGGRLNDILHSVKSNYHGTSKEMTNLKRKWQRKEKRLLEHLRSAQTKEYLVGIQRDKVMSHRHQWFLSCNPSDKGRLLRGSFGALINEKKRFEIVNYLRDLLTSDKCPLSSPRYMMEVALPEALNFAYQKTNRVNKDEAEQLIHKDGQQVIRDLDIG